MGAADNGRVIKFTSLYVDIKSGIFRQISLFSNGFVIIIISRRYRKRDADLRARAADFSAKVIGRHVVS